MGIGTLVYLLGNYCYCEYLSNMFTLCLYNQGNSCNFIDCAIFVEMSSVTLRSKAVSIAARQLE